MFSRIWRFATSENVSTSKFLNTSKDAFENYYVDKYLNASKDAFENNLKVF